ncbi:hypothetical protein QSJ18_11990, partial [Gordonia sp. ABSL1-1]|uniref:TPR repeat region-containing protein n=1 Tax=Gordonia sp. ABSL1-1 TaxID=3053923 RepID=UPI0025724EBF
MPYPTLSDVLVAQPANYLTLRDGLTGLATSVDAHARGMVSAVTGVAWDGHTREAAVGRANEEKTAFGRIANVAREAASSIGAHVTSLQGLQAVLILDVIELFLDNYVIGDDWTVHDAMVYPGGDPVLDSVNAKVRERREQAARDYTSALKGKAGEFAAADRSLAHDAHSGIEGLNTLSPAGSAVSIRAADRLLDELRHHRQLSPTELTELREAAGLTPEQIEAIREGRPVSIAPNRYAYLRELMVGLDEMSPSEIDHLADYLGGRSGGSVQASLANGLQLMGNPLVNDGFGHHGGMAALPSKVREALQRTPVSFDTSYMAEVGPLWKLNNYHDLLALKDLLGKGDPALRVNTDIDRGLLKQAAELAGATSNREGLFLQYEDENGRLVKADDLTETINGLAGLVSVDHPA